MPQNFCVSKGGELSSLLGIPVRKVNHLQTKAALNPQLFKDPVIVVQPSFGLAVSHLWTMVYTIEPTRQPFKKILNEFVLNLLTIIPDSFFNCTIL